MKPNFTGILVSYSVSEFVQIDERILHGLRRHFQQLNHLIDGGRGSSVVWMSVCLRLIRLMSVGFRIGPRGQSTKIDRRAAADTMAPAHPWLYLKARMT